MKRRFSFSKFIEQQWDLLAAAILAAGIFCMQAAYVHLAAAPISDEGVYAEAGRMMLEGLVPYRDFSYLHPPLLPMFTALGLWLGNGDIAAPRVMYLALNCMSILPLFLVLRRFGGKVAALLAIAFYVTFDEMVLTDFRFLATRQFVNVFLIVYLYSTVMVKRQMLKISLQFGSALCAMLTMLPAAVPLVAISLAAVAAEPKRKRMQSLRTFSYVGGAVALLTVLLFLIPNAPNRLLWMHVEAPLIFSRIFRWKFMMDPRNPDFLMYLLGLLGMIAGMFYRARRPWALAMLTTFILIFLPREFYGHYPVSAAIAFAWGIMTVGWILTDRYKAIWWFAPLMIAVLVSLQWNRTLPTLLREWHGNRGATYWTAVDTFRQLPEPVLTLYQPIYVIQARKRSTQHYFRATRQTFVPPAPEYYERAAEQSCSIALGGFDLKIIPAEVLRTFREKNDYQGQKNGFEVYLTNLPGCDNGGAT